MTRSDTHLPAHVGLSISPQLTEGSSFERPPGVQFAFLTPDRMRSYSKAYFWTFNMV